MANLTEISVTNLTEISVANLTEISVVNISCERYQPLEIIQEFHKYSTFSISIVGSFLNLLCLSVLIHPSLDNVFNRIRIMLATYDLLYLFSNTLYLFSTNLGWHSDFEQASLIVLALSSSGSAFTTVALAVERCYAIIFPLKCEDNNMTASSKRFTFCCYLFPVLIISVIQNLPTLLSSGSAFEAYHAHANGFKIFTIVLTTIRIIFYISSNYYILNFCLKMRNSRSDDCQFALQFVVISISSIILHIAWITFLISGQFKKETGQSICGLKSDQQIWHKVLYDFSDILWVLNSAGNFFIYNLLGDKFRKAMKKTYARHFESVVETVEDIKHDVSRRGSAISQTFLNISRRGSVNSDASAATAVSNVSSEPSKVSPHSEEDQHLQFVSSVAVHDLNNKEE